MNSVMSERLKKLPPYLFAEIDRLKQETIKQGHDVIDLGIGDPDIVTPSLVVDELCVQSRKLDNQRYPSTKGMGALRKEIAAWLKKRFSVVCDPESEIVTLIGSKEGIAHFPLGILNNGDVALVPDPCYPPYKSGVIFAGGEIVLMPLLRKNNFLPSFSDISTDTLKKAKIMYLNYPNNPTAACATEDFYKEAVALAKKYNIFICSDLAYSEVTFDGYAAPSILEIEGAKDVAIEFHSLSKTYNMTGWRIAFAYGNSELVSLLTKVKSNIDSGAFQAVQLAGLRALQQGDAEIKKNLAVYEQRRLIIVEGLKSLGFDFVESPATFYLWISVPSGYNSAEYCMKLLKEAHLIVTPGNGFGPSGEGYFRIALTVDSKRLPEVIERLRKVML